MSMKTTSTQYRTELHDLRKHLRHDSVAENPENIRQQRRLGDLARLRALRQTELLLRDYSLQGLRETSGYHEARELTTNPARELAAAA